MRRIDARLVLVEKPFRNKKSLKLISLRGCEKTRKLYFMEREIRRHVLVIIFKLYDRFSLE
jgi:hypothetical protein